MCYHLDRLADILQTEEVRAILQRVFEQMDHQTQPSQSEEPSHQPATLEDLDELLDEGHEDREQEMETEVPEPESPNQHHDNGEEDDDCKIIKEIIVIQ